jgi:hypothetical protein
LESHLPGRGQPVKAGAARATAKRLGLEGLAPVWLHQLKQANTLRSSIMSRHSPACEAILPKSAIFPQECRNKRSKYKALHNIAAQGVKKSGAALPPPKQCADKDNFGRRPDVVPSSFILPSCFTRIHAAFCPR